MLVEPVVFAPNELYPIATLFDAVVLASKDKAHIAIFCAPVVFTPKAS